MADSALNLLGLALRGGNLAVGEEPVAEACRARRARVVLLAADAGPSTARRGEKLAGEGGVPLARLACTKRELGWALGRESCALCAPTQRGLAQAVLRRLAQGGAPPEGAAREAEKTGRAGSGPADVEA